MKAESWGPNNFAMESVSHCDQAALVSCRVVALLRKGPYGDAAKKAAEFVQAWVIERITAGARHAHHALIIRAQLQPKASALQPGKHGDVFFRHRMTA